MLDKDSGVFIAGLKKGFAERRETLSGTSISLGEVAAPFLLRKTVQAALEAFALEASDWCAQPGFTRDVIANWVVGGGVEVRRDDFVRSKALLDGVLRSLVSGRQNDAKLLWRDLVARWSHCTEVLRSAADALASAGHVDDAIEVYQAALAYAPTRTELNNNLGVILKWKGRYEEAMAHFEWLRFSATSDAQRLNAYVNMGSALLDLGRIEDAACQFDSALDIDPADAEARSNALLLSLHRSGLTRDELFAGHLEFGERHSSEGSLEPRRFSQHVSRRARVGFVSGDLRRHAVATLLAPAWREFTSTREGSVFAYHAHPVEDEVSREFQRSCEWRNVSGLDDEQLVAMIRKDRIDVLIDLSGHTSRNRLTALARKPAPLQMSWLGYPYSTGLRSIDYYIADRFWVPPGVVESNFVENLIRIPAAATFQLPDDAPEVNPLPRLTRGHWTFGSFNRPGKVSHATVALWASALRLDPTSRICIGGMLGSGHVTRVLNELRALGIRDDQIEFLPRLPMRDYLTRHHDIDILLDSTPYGAGSTSLFGAWMGLPTLTIGLDVPQGRQTAAIMLHLGLDEFVVPDGARWSEQLLRVLQDPAALNKRRLSLRQRLRESVVCDSRGLAHSLSEAIDFAWHRHCQGLAPATFDIGCSGLVG